MRGEKVVLTGMSGAGKTATGQALCDYLASQSSQDESAKHSWVDIDAEIERQVGCSIADLIRVEGEQQFRKLESETIHKAIQSDVTIIAVGGGALLDPQSRQVIEHAMAEGALVVHLAVSDSELCRRVIADEQRALEAGAAQRRPIIFGALKQPGEKREVLNAKKTSERILELRKQRQQFYQLASLTVWTDFAPASAVAKAIGDELIARSKQKKLVKKRVRRTVIVNSADQVSMNSESTIILGPLQAELSGKMLSIWPKGKKVTVVVDEAIVSTAGKKVQNELQSGYDNCELLPIATGENAKTFAVVNELMSQFAKRQIARDDVVVAVGGGAVGDAVGLAASLYLRGVGLVHVPTTLVAQVDSAIGGKTAINTDYGKNTIGTFYPAQLVYIDVNLLQTLPDREYLSGVAEVVKYGLIRSAEFFEWLEQNAEKIIARDADTLKHIVEFSVVTKQSLVQADLRDTTGIRALLNFGHTIGHAIEKLSGYGQFLHGEAISIGMVEALTLGVMLKRNDIALVKRVALLLQKFRLPVHMPPELKAGAADFLRGWKDEGERKWLSENAFAVRWWEAICADKKRSGDDIQFILLERLGDAVVVKVQLATILRSIALPKEEHLPV